MAGNIAFLLPTILPKVWHMLWANRSSRPKRTVIYHLMTKQVFSHDYWSMKSPYPPLPSERETPFSPSYARICPVPFDMSLFPQMFIRHPFCICHNFSTVLSYRSPISEAMSQTARWAAAIVIVFLGVPDEAGSEVYSSATDLGWLDSTCYLNLETFAIKLEI